MRWIFAFLLLPLASCGQLRHLVPVLAALARWPLFAATVIRPAQVYCTSGVQAEADLAYQGRP